jgi:hypothetical protein
MVDIFNTGSSLSKEEEDFRLNQRLGTENVTGTPIPSDYYGWGDFGSDVLKNIKKVPEYIGNLPYQKIQQNNISNMTNANAPILPNLTQLNGMNKNQLLSLKKQVEFQLNNAASAQYQTAFQVTLQNIEKALLNKVQTNSIDQNEELQNEVVSSTAGDNVILASTNETLKAKASANPDLDANSSTITATSGADTGSNDNKNAADGNVDHTFSGANLYNTDENVNALLNNVQTQGNDQAEKNGTPNYKQSQTMTILKNKVIADVQAYKSQQAENDVERQRDIDSSKDPAEVKASALEKITQELKDVIPEMEVPKELLMLKFGTELLKARSDRRGGKLPRFLDELGQALTPLTDTLMGLALEKQKLAQEIGGKAYEIYREDKKLKEALWRPDPAAYVDVLTIGYDEKGAPNGQVEFFKSILSPAEAEMYNGMVYPEVINGVKVPEGLVGRPIFRISDKLLGEAALDQTFFDGPLKDSKGGIDKSITMLNFIRQGGDTAAQVLSIGDKHHAQGNNIFGFTFNVRNIGKTLKDMTIEGSQLFTQITGTKQGENYAAALGDASSQAEKELIAFNTLYGLNLNYDQIVSQSQNNYKELQTANKEALDNGWITQDQFHEGQAELSKLYTDAGMFSSSDISIIPLLETNMTFSYARYIQGSNRLLKDVIKSARQIVNLDGWFNTDRKVMDRYNTLLDYFVNEYNQELLKLFSPETVKDNGWALTRDGNSISGGYINAGKISTANNSDGAGYAAEGQDLENELEGFVNPNLIQKIWE